MSRGTFFILLLTTVILLTSCQRNNTLKSESKTIELELLDYRLKPQDIRVPAGKIKFIVKNSGKTPHNLAISNGNFVLSKTTTLNPNEKQEMQISLPSGDYKLFSYYADDDLVGLNGTLKVGNITAK